MLRFEDTEIEFVGEKESYHFESRNPLSKTELLKTIKTVVISLLMPGIILEY
jgi:hypothetical protein